MNITQSEKRVNDMSDIWSLSIEWIDPAELDAALNEIITPESIEAMCKRSEELAKELYQPMYLVWIASNVWDLSSTLRK